jgi:hypothetical protein
MTGVPAEGLQVHRSRRLRQVEQPDGRRWSQAQTTIIVGQEALQGLDEADARLR